MAEGRVAGVPKMFPQGDAVEPELRIEGFNDEWKTKGLVDLAQRFDSLRKPVTAHDRIPGATPYYGATGIQDYVQGWTHDGEYILIAEDGMTDLNDYPIQIASGKIWVNNHAHVIQAYADVADNRFLGNSLKLADWKTLVSGGTRMKLNASSMMTLRLKVPSLKEQRAIGELFAKLDHEIAARRKKLTKLQQTKTSLLQIMFPQGDAVEPELRIEGFTGKWKQTRLGDVAVFINGRAYSQDELLDAGKYPVLRVGNFYTNTNWYYSDLELNESMYANNGDLLYTWSATFGPHIWVGGKVIYHYHIWKVKTSTQLEKLFAVQLLTNDRDSLFAGHSGSTMPHITKEGMENKLVMIPDDVEEQRAIGELFAQLDDLIATEQLYVEKLRQVKASLLQKMFV